MSDETEPLSDHPLKAKLSLATQIGLGAILMAAGGAGANVLGLTVEPAYVTELRVENARLTERLDNIEPLLKDCQALVHAMDKGELNVEG